MDLESAKLRLHELFARSDSPNMPEPGAQLAIYGAGNCGCDALRVLREHGYHVKGFVDVNAQDNQWVHDTPCHQPGSRESVELAASGIPILLAVFNYTADTGQIEASLYGDGFISVLPYAILSAKFPGHLKSTFWLADRHFFQIHQMDMLRALSLWEDDASRDIFVESIELRLTHNLQLLRHPDRENQYFPKDLPAPQEPIRAIDGGAYVGDTLASMLRFRVEAVAAFEPDTQNFEALRRWIRNESQHLPCPLLFPYGLGAKTAITRFQQGNAAASCVSSQGDTAIQIVALDEALPNFEPNFIKLDVEGAEMAALIGASAMIRRDQPRIAACIYHRPTDFWEIPLLLRELVPAHRLHLRYHGYNGFDAVAYAIPR